VIEIQGEEREFPLRATVSSFGAGGSNVHFILEEYIPSEKDNIHLRVAEPPQVGILSDINRERLMARANQLLGYLEQQSDDA
ncbi:hypothetical protein JDS79_44775, partial [Bacillus cereus]|nr:hypothetical protein [Bacillus cereus]